MEKYNQLFCNEHIKAEAFDKIAEKFYNSNFGSISKSDFEVLMFSIYIERILENNEDDFNSYSDYTLSKDLGITQSRVSSLKVRKELIYPYKNFSWVDSFSRISKNAVYEDGKIKIFIPDKNLYIELKHAIEQANGFVETQLTTNLLQVRPEYFLDLMIELSDEKDKKILRKQIRKTVQAKNEGIEFFEKDSIGKSLKRKAPNIIIDIICACIPYFGSALKIALENVVNTMRNK